MARAFGERCHYIYAPVITRTAEIRNTIVQDANYEKISNLNYSIGMAASREKIPAIMGACKSEAINVLITDEMTVKIILNELGD